VKRKYFHTKWHCDAFNTVFQRGLLELENIPSDETHDPDWTTFRKTGNLCSSWESIPIFTFWVALRPVDSPSSSHLRISPKSHSEPGMRLVPELRNIIPEGYQYHPKNYHGPPFPEGYGVGDIVVFHCLTQHEANAHTKRDVDGVRGSGERVSIDGRFFMRLI
jgi:hypothetical protein